MAIYQNPDWISPDLFKYINFMLQGENYVSSLALNSAMDEIFREDPWWEFEYETILQTFEQMGFSLPNVHVLGQIQCIASIRNGKSFIDKEWHIFEKACLTLCAVPVLFYEKQNVPIECVYHALTLMKKLGTLEISDEVMHYIGCEAINDEILWHPNTFIDNALTDALARIKEDIGISENEISDIRSATKTRFNDIVNKDLDKINFDQSNIADMMCARIYRSIVIGKNLAEAEFAAITEFEDIKNGRKSFNKGETAEVPADVIPNDADEDNVVFENTGEVEVDSFDDGVKEVMLSKMAELIDLFKEGSFKNVPIETGVPVSGGEDDSDGPSNELVSTPPMANMNAVDAHEYAKNDQLNNGDSGGSKHEVLDPSIAFEL